MKVIKFKNEKKDRIFFPTFCIGSLSTIDFRMIHDALCTYRIALASLNEDELLNKCDSLLMNMNYPSLKDLDPYEGSEF